MPKIKDLEDRVHSKTSAWEQMFLETQQLSSSDEYPNNKGVNLASMIFDETPQSEIIAAYDLNNEIYKIAPREDILTEMKEFYLKNGIAAPFAVRVVYLILNHPDFGIYVLQRSNKSENPYHWSVSVGGHEIYGEDSNTAIKRETLEEIQIPINIVSKQEYERLISSDINLDESGIVTYAGYLPNLELTKKDRDTGRIWIKKVNATVYIGRSRKVNFKFNNDFDYLLNKDLEVNGLQKEVNGIEFDPKDELLIKIQKKTKDYGFELQYLIKQFYDLL